MTYLRLFVLLLTLTACSGTRRVIESEPQNTSENPQFKITKVIDSTSKTTTVLKSTITEKKEDSVTTVSKNDAKIYNHDSWDYLLQKHVSSTGKVNYKTFKTDRKLLLDYIKSLSDFMPQESWQKADKLAYWINTYNALTIDLILQHYPINSIKTIKKPWDQRLWKLGNKWYNLNEIEHQILRKMNEPRIHFAIVCASVSCPKLQNRAYTAPLLNEQLSQATKIFLADKTRNEISENHINLSKIFQWFSKDFKTENNSLINFLNHYSEVTISNTAKKSFKDYNWDLNE